MPCKILSIKSLINNLYIYLSLLSFLCPCKSENQGIVKHLFQFSSVTHSCLTLCNPMSRSTPGLPVHHQLPEFTQTHVHRVSDSIQPSHPLSSLFLLPPIPPSTRVFSNESTLRMRWLKYGVSASASFLPKKSQG